MTCLFDWKMSIWVETLEISSLRIQFASFPLKPAPSSCSAYPESGLLGLTFVESKRKVLRKGHA